MKGRTSRRAPARAARRAAPDAWLAGKQDPVRDLSTTTRYYCYCYYYY